MRRSALSFWLPSTDEGAELAAVSGILNTMAFTLSSAADFILGKKVQLALKLILLKAGGVFGYQKERENRLRRFLRIVNDYKSGMPMNAIMNKYGVSRGTIRRYAALANIPPRKPFRAQPAEIRRGVVSAYKAGKSLDEISALFGVSKAYISTTATKEGINRKKDKRRVKNAN